MRLEKTFNFHSFFSTKLKFLTYRKSKSEKKKHYFFFQKCMMRNAIIVSRVVIICTPIGIKKILLDTIEKPQFVA